MPENDLGIAERLRRKMGRPARTRSIAVRFAEDEAKRIAEATEKRGVAVREWARDAMLEAAAGVRTDVPVFTELMALRLLVTNTLHISLTDETLITPEAYAKLLAEVRADKHEVARDVLDKQYGARPSSTGR